MKINLLLIKKMLCSYLIAWQFLFLIIVNISPVFSYHSNNSKSPLAFIESSDIYSNTINLPTKTRDTNTQRNGVNNFCFSFDQLSSSVFFRSKIKSIKFNSSESVPIYKTNQPNKFSFRGPPLV
ncbi:MAG: hypothetical protein V1773_00080 [bacterium]